MLQHFTQYIPLSVCELHLWMGSPSIYVFDCSNAGCIVDYIRKNVPSVRNQHDAVSFLCFSVPASVVTAHTLYAFNCPGNNGI